MNIPASMQPTLERWKQNLSLGEGMRFSNPGNVAAYEQMMDRVVLADNGPEDANPARGEIVSRDDGESLQFQGNSHEGSLEAVTADGRLVALNFSQKAVDFLQLSEKPGGGVEALHEHFDRTGSGQNWMQLGGAVTVIEMDEPGALDQIFGSMGSAGPIPGLSSENQARAARIGAVLAGKLEVAPEAVQLSAFEHKGFNAGNCGFPVAGELQMSAWTEGLELKFSCDGEKYVYRGLDEKDGCFGVDQPEHEGYWKVDERGIYVPDMSAGSSGFAEGW